MTRITSIHRTAIGGAAVLCCCLLAGCGGSGAANTGAAAPRPAGAHGGPAGLPASTRLGSSGGSVPGASAANRSGGAKQATATAHLAPADQSIIYTASLKVRAPDVMAAAKKAIAIATAAGGYVADERAASDDGMPRGSVDLTLKIPVPAYQAVLAQLSSASIGKQLALQQQATDMTQEVADVTSLVSSQRAAISALQGLLKRAGSVSGLLQVQQQISSDESGLNSLLSQQRALNDETSYATVSMTLVRPPAPVRHHHHKTARRGFLTGLSAGWRAMRHTAAWLATALGIMLPFLVVVVVLAGAGLAATRRFLRRRAAGQANP